VASTVVTLSGNPSMTLNGVYEFQGWLYQRPIFANGEDGILYHDGEHWKARAGALPPGEAAAAVPFAAWIRSSEALPPEGDWLNFSESGNISSITNVSVSVRGREQAAPFSSPRAPSSSPEIGSDLASEAARGVPAELRVESPTKQVAFAGQYRLVLNQNPNGYPLWKHICHERYLYSGINGKWHFGANPEKEKGFFCSRGFVLHPSRHNGLMPSQLPTGEWKAYNGITHETDPCIKVSELAIDASGVSIESSVPAQEQPRPFSQAVDGQEPAREPVALSPGPTWMSGRPPRPEQSGPTWINGRAP